MTKIVAEIRLPSHVVGRGQTRHFRDGELVSHRVSLLRIADYGDDSGFYIHYFDQEGNELNDLFFDSLAQAYDHIEWEFGMKVGR